jgi:hypothetical protein
MCLTDLDLDLDLPEITDDEEHAPRPDLHPIDGQYAGVAWGLAERQDGQYAAPAS